MNDTIVRVAARGEGVTADGRHVAFAAPGDRLSSGVVVPGPHHQPPPCRLFPRCGGCQLQHLDDASYSAFVADRVATALAAQAIEAPLRAVVVSPPRSRRRATLHAAKQSGGMAIGFAEARSHALVDLTECHILHPDLFALLAPLRALLGRVAGSSRFDVHLTRCDQGIDLLVKAPLKSGLDVAEAVSRFCDRHGAARFAVDDGLGAETRWEPRPATITLGDTPVAMPPGAFLQATADGEATLVDAMREAVGDARTTADLFAGLGTFALALPGRVYAAEGARDAILALKAAANAGQRAIFADHRDLYRRPLTPAELDRFDAVVLDPPRAGAREQIVALAACRTRAIGYVSCNPASFARDARGLIDGGWRLDWVQPVGQFRWSTHVELAARFSR